MINLEAKIKLFLESKGYSVEKFGEVKSGYRNFSYPIYLQNGEVINFILYKNEKGILQKVKNANVVGSFLASHGFPSRSNIKGLELIELKNENHIRYGSFYKYLSGETIPWESYTSKHIKLLGGALGKLHKVIHQFNNSLIQQFPEEIEIQLAIIDRTEKYFIDENVLNALNSKLNLNIKINWNKFKRLFELLQKEEKQILHMDFVRSNVLFSSEVQSETKNQVSNQVRNDTLVITGILDFEKTSYGPRIIDIARTLAFLLVDCKFKDPKKVWKYFLFNGYRKRGENELPDLKYLKRLIIHFWIYDFYKFLKYNPYEFLPQNDHFIRTRSFLSQSGVIQS